VIVVISHPEFFNREAGIINELFSHGMEYFHLRKPGCTKDEYIWLLNKIEKEFLHKIVLHNHHQLIDNYGCMGIHINETERKTPHIRFAEYSKKLVSTSVHSIEDYLKLEEDFSYAFFSPVFDSISKSNHKSIVDDNFHISAEDKSNVKLIALGGIQSQNAQKALSMGFDGVALLGALWQNINSAVDEYKKVTQQC